MHAATLLLRDVISIRPQPHKNLRLADIKKKIINTHRAAVVVILFIFHIVHTFVNASDKYMYIILIFSFNMRNLMFD